MFSTLPNIFNVFFSVIHCPLTFPSYCWMSFLSLGVFSISIHCPKKIPQFFNVFPPSSHHPYHLLRLDMTSLNLNTTPKCDFNDYKNNTIVNWTYCLCHFCTCLCQNDINDKSYSNV